MNIEDFNFFLRVAHLGSMSQAAKEANIAISVASQRIQRLENQLKLRLFYRSTRKLTLTEEAKILIAQGQPLLQNFQILTENLQHHDQNFSGNIHMTASAVFSQHVLIPILAKFMQRYPNLKIHLDLNDQNVDLITQGMDLAIRIGKLQDSSLVAIPLMTNPRLLCASPEYIKQYGQPQGLEDLKQHSCIVQRHQQGVSDTWFFTDDFGEIESIGVSGHFVTNSGEGIRQAALAGLGISNHSLWHVQEDLDCGRLIQVLPDFTVETTAIYAIIPDKKLVPKKVSVLIDCLKQHFQHHELEMSESLT